MTDDETPVEKKRWPFSWGRAEWVPLGLLVLWFIGNSIPNRFYSLQLSNAWHVVPVGILSSLAGGGIYLVIIWGSLSTQSVANRITYTVFAMLFIKSIDIALNIATFTIPSITASLILWLMISLWRCWKGWQMTNLNLTTNKSNRIQFSIKDIFAWTTATALIATWICVLNELFGQEILSMPQITLGWFSTQLIYQIAYCILLVSLATVAMMDREKIPIRAFILFTLVLVLQLPLFIYSFRWIYLVFILPKSILSAVGALLAGLLMRWAGYRIQKTPVTPAIAE